MWDPKRGNSSLAPTKDHKIRAQGRAPKQFSIKQQFAPLYGHSPLPFQPRLLRLQGTIRYFLSCYLLPLSLLLSLLLALGHEGGKASPCRCGHDQHNWAPILGRNKDKKTMKPKETIPELEAFPGKLREDFLLHKRMRHQLVH